MSIVTDMVFEAMDFSGIIGAKGFSEKLLKNHFTLYQGYAANTNKIIAALDEIARTGKRGSIEYSELKRRFGWEYNGMRLHELYFENIAMESKGINAASKLSKRIAEAFGSFEEFEKDFKATGAMRGIGWVVLYHDKTSGRLFNEWIGEHDEGHLAGAAPIIVMDVFEHAYMVDYELKKADYIEAFFKAINWEVAEKRFK